ncbi:hypothetical protein ACQPZ8_32210 [Actinomadura nitritigenes]|uniref:hypothetical protein n=1 Tax=Actinomadura nitritigenes TaxID=134602 RepID=UPI003D8D4312
MSRVEPGRGGRGGDGAGPQERQAQRQAAQIPESARRSIRRRYAEGEVSLADPAGEYSVGRSAIHRIIHGPLAGQS